MTVNLGTGKPINLSKEAEAKNLFEHGTRPWNLNAANLVQAAERDLRVRERNKAKLNERAKGYATEPLEPFGFLQIHITGNFTPRQILESALAGISLGRQSTKRSTLMLYESADRLQEAIELCDD